jgi:hypothetical protein
MLSYHKLKDRSRDFLAATGFMLAEFQQLLPAFQGAYEKRYPPALTHAGTPWQRRAGGGAKGTLHSIEDKFLFILAYKKTGSSPLNCLSLPKFFQSVSDQNAFNEGMQGVHPVP